MKRTLLVLAAAFSLSANAEIMTTDKSSLNDQKVAFDTESGLEWLKFNKSPGVNVVTMESYLAQPNGAWAGWRFPTVQEVVGLITGNFMTPEEFNVNDLKTQYLYTAPKGTYNAADKLLEEMGTIRKTSTRYTSTMMFRDNDEVWILHTLTRTGADNSSDDYLGLYKVSDSNETSSGYNMLLVSDGGATYSSLNDPVVQELQDAAKDVSLPLGGVFAAGLLGAMALRRKQKA